MLENPTHKIIMNHSNNSYSSYFAELGSKVIQLIPAPPITNHYSTKHATLEEKKGGDDNMSGQYATKEELKTLDTKLSGQFETLMAKVDGQFDTMSTKIDGKFDTMSATMESGFKSTKAETETRFAKFEASQTKWFIATIVGVVSLVVGILKFF